MSNYCPNCGVEITGAGNFCPQCGIALEEVGYDPASGIPPRTIEELQAYCAYHGMPLEKMRFFVGTDYKQPKAFGIYRENDRFVVYKNKADGSRAVRYQGPDEAYAVNELYQKLLEECHNRDIWPDGKPEGYEKAQRRKRNVLLIVVIVVLLCCLGSFVLNRIQHAHDGYYLMDDHLYYHYGSSWYFSDDDDWYLWRGGFYDNYGDYYVGSGYDPDWGYSDFRSSDAWEDIQEESRTSSRDYDSWDSGSTDWDSDW